MRRVIRESLAYAAHYRGKRFVVKLGEKISPEAGDLGLIQDIILMRLIGVQIVVVLRWNSTDLGAWLCMPDVDLHDVRDHSGIIDSLNRGMMPVAYWREESKNSINEAASVLASSVGACKLVYVTHLDGVHADRHRLIHQMTLDEARALLDHKDRTKRHIVQGPMRDKVQYGIAACEAGVQRVHIISGRSSDALIAEIFSSEGVGTLIFREAYHHIRPARPSDCHPIRDVLGDANIVPIPSHMELVAMLDRLHVLVADGDHVQGCMCVTEYQGAGAIELSRFAVVQWADSPETRINMMEYVRTVAHERGIMKVFLRPGQNESMLLLHQWFIAFGFKEGILGKLAINTDIKYPSQERVWSINIFDE